MRNRIREKYVFPLIVGIFFSLIGILYVDAASPYQSEENTVLLLHFDEGKGLPKDSSGKNNHASRNTATWIKDKEKGWVLRFGKPGDYVSIPHSESLKVTKELTVEACVRWRGKSWDSWGLIVDKRDWKNSRAGYFLAITDERKVIFGINGHGLGRFYIISDICVKENDWSHIAGVFKPGRLEVWVDGVGKGISISDTTIHSTTTPIIIGKEQPPGLLHLFNGDIDELKISNIARFKRAPLVPISEKVQPIKFGYLVWKKNPFQKLHIGAKPPKSTSDLKKLSISACINEYEPAVFVLTNLTNRTIRGRVIIGKLVNEKGEVFPLEQIKVRLPSFVKTADIHAGRSPVKVAGIFADPLPLANQANEFILPPDQPQEIWLEINTKDVSPGIYRGYIHIKPHLGGKDKKIMMQIKVYPIVLPVDLPASLWVQWALWSRFTPDNEEVAKKYLEDLRAHKINTFNLWGPAFFVEPVLNKKGEVIEPLNKDQLKKLDSWIKLFRKYGFNKFIYGFCGKLNNLGCGLKFMSAEWKEVLEIWLKALVAHFKQLGFDYDDFALWYSDEINNRAPLSSIQSVDRFLQASKVIKEIDPNVRIFLSYAWSTSNQVIEQASPYVDIACVRIPPPRLQKKQWNAPCEPERWKRITKAKEVWFYNTWGHKEWDPFVENRAFVWNLFKYKFAGGYGMFMYHNWGSYGKKWDCDGDPWNDFDSPKMDECLIYDNGNFAISPNLAGPIPSRRWEGVREGFEDCLYLYLLEDLIKNAEKKGVDTSKAKEIIREFNEEVFYDRNPERIYEFRNKLIQEAIKLKKMLSNKR